MKIYSICMIGFGNVGKAFANLIRRKEKTIADEYNISFKITAIATGSHGQAIDPDGIDLKNALFISANNRSLNELSAISTPDNINEFIALSKADFLLENSPVNYETGEPAITHIQAALANKMHAVSANKGPIVHAYTDLSALARKSGKQYLFESAVMDGAPIFSVFREVLPAAEIIGFEGILNSCTNLLIEKMEEGNILSMKIRN